jgi:hypothetical protein
VISIALCFTYLQLDDRSVGSYDEAAELKINPQFREIKKLKPVLRRLLPSRTQFAKIEELFNCDVDMTSDEDNHMASAQFTLDMIGEEDFSEEEEDFSDEEQELEQEEATYSKPEGCDTAIHVLGVIGEEDSDDDVAGDEEEEEARQSVRTGRRSSADVQIETEARPQVSVAPQRKDSGARGDWRGSSGSSGSPEVLRSGSQGAVALVANVSSDKALSMGSGDRKGPRRRNNSGFQMGNPMSSPRPSLDEGGRESSSSVCSVSSVNSVGSVNSMDRLPRGVNVFRKPSLDIFQSTKRK